MPLPKKRGLFSCIVVCAILGISGCETGFNEPSAIPLAGPRSIQITPRDRELVVQWTKVAPARGVTPTYRLYWSTASTPGTDWIFVDTHTSSLIQGYIPNLVNRQRYSVWVKAVFEGLGESAFSPVSYAAPIPPPETLGIITVYSGYQMLELRWEEVEDAAAYEVYSGTTGGDAPPAGAAMKTVPEPGAILHGLANGMGYTLWVRAVNTAGDSGWRTAIGTPATGGTPTAPESITAAGGDAKITVTWDQVPGVKAYILYYNTTDDFSGKVAGPTVTADAPKNTADITGLANGVPYHVWVVSSNGVESVSAPSPAASARTAARPPIQWNAGFTLGNAAAEFSFAQDLPVSAFWPEGRPSTDRLTRVQETALGDLFADGAAWYLRTKQNKNIDFVFINGGYIDNALLRGSVTVGSLMGIIYPDSRTEDKFVIVTMKGSELKKFFYNPDREVSLAAWNEEMDVAGVVHTGRGSGGTGFFGAVSKEVRYTIEYPQAPPASPALNADRAEPYYHGRIKPGTLKINDADFDDDTEYRIGTTDYLASGAYFTGLFTGRIAIEGIDVLFWRGVAEYIYDKGTITPYTDGRIKIEGGVPLPAPWINSTWKPIWLE
ncbi:MAG: 5'-nucleotidase C-terminal domain-containing protein [Spirochaetota bacterium]|jgi:hypothetical protein|nr:5'-nucleotidase C-terminal domain-containing protein [Spirochaetota bacterium]